MNLSEKEMKSVTGGAVSWKVIAGICAAVAYLIGVVSGYTNPNKCNNSKN